VPVPAVAVYILYPGTEEVSRLEVIPAEKVAVIALLTFMITTPEPPFPPLTVASPELAPPPPPPVFDVPLLPLFPPL
jgi:hypothetical protein